MPVHGTGWQSARLQASRLLLCDCRSRGSHALSLPHCTGQVKLFWRQPLVPAVPSAAGLLGAIGAPPNPSFSLLTAGPCLRSLSLLLVSLLRLVG
jgi:hypothetical protein